MFSISELNPIVLTTSIDSDRWLTTKKRCEFVGITAVPYVNNCNLGKRKNATYGHLQIIKQLRDLNSPYGLIFEDDVCFSEQFPILYQSVMEQLNCLNWDLFYFGANLLNKAERISNNILRPQLAYCNHAYFINQSIYDQAIDLLEKALSEEVIVDDAFSRAGWNLFVCNPMLITQLPAFHHYEELLLIHNIMEEGYKHHA